MQTKYRLLSNLLTVSLLLVGAPISAEYEPVQLTHFKGTDTDPAISPNGRWMLYSSDRQGNNRMELWLMDLSSGKTSLFLPNYTVNSPAAWNNSSSGFIAALAAITDDTKNRENERLRYVDLTSHTVSAPLFPTSRTSTQLFPSLAPDNNKVAYAVLLDSGTTDFNIMLGDRKTGQTTVVIQSPYRDLWPRFENGGQSLIYFSRRDTNGTDDEIYRYNIRTKFVSRLTHSPGHDFTPHPSPDNAHIAFVSKRTPVNAVFLMDKGGNNVRRISPVGIRAGHPTWGQDDRDLFVTLRKDGAPADIYRIKITGHIRP